MRTSRAPAPRSHRARRKVPLATFAVLVLTGCTARDEHLSFLDPQGPIAQAQREHFGEIVALLCIVVLPVFVLVPLFAWRYRYSNAGAVYRPRWDGNKPLEIVTWGIPVAIVALMGALLIRSTAELDPYRPIVAGDLVPEDAALASNLPPLSVQVVGTDWNWLFVYPELGIATTGELAFPADRQLALALTSMTAMQSFFVPALGSQIYAMGGMANRLHLAADAPGDFMGRNTQYNGDGFFQQEFVARAMEPGDFDAWVDEVRTSGAPLGDAALSVLTDRNTQGQARKALPEAGDAPDALYFASVPERLFERLMQHSRTAPNGRVAGPLPLLESSLSMPSNDRTDDLLCRAPYPESPR